MECLAIQGMRIALLISWTGPGNPFDGSNKHQSAKNPPRTGLCERSNQES